MLKLDLLPTPREFEVNGYRTRDFGALALIPDGPMTTEFITFKTDSGKSCDFYATHWGFYLGASANSRLKKEGFKVGLMLNELNQLYVVAVENEKMDHFKEYLTNNNSKVLSWLDEWMAGSEIGSRPSKPLG